ncbi:efflux RND transporter permease subunit, partial [Methylobacterium sp. D48H]
RVWVDPNKLAAYGLSVTDVTAALQEQNVQVAAGQLDGPPAAKGEAFQLVVQSQARFKTPEQFAEDIIKAQDGRLVRVKDIARVEMGQKDYTTNSFLNDT